jgi:hypothetical protein
MKALSLFREAASQVKFTRCVLAAIISVLCVANAKASTITYTESATVSGSLNGTSFTNELLTLTGTGDTATIVGTTGYITISLTPSFSVAGVGSGTLTSPFVVFEQQSNSAVGFELTGSLDLLDTFNAVFATYNLSTSIGPATGSSAINAGHSFSTNVGPLILTSAGDATFTAVGGSGPPPSAVPLPAALPLFATGLAGLGLLGWRRKKTLAA